MLLLFGGEDDVQDQLARYGLDHLKGVDVDELPGIGHHFDDPDDVERVAAAVVQLAREAALGPVSGRVRLASGEGRLGRDRPAVRSAPPDRTR